MIAPPFASLLGNRRTPVLLVAFAAIGAAALTFIAPSASAAHRSTATTTLAGTLELAAGSCSGGKVTGTYLRMILPSGGTNGPYMSNSDSRCSDQSFTPLAPGTDGGLRVGSYQPIPSPAFSASGDARARRITAPAPFYGTSFATATNPVDPQTKRAVPAPRLTLTGSTLSADLRAFSVTWNNQHFNQGAPKPDGSTPGNTRRATGTYDASTGAFTLEWTSQVVGGPFDKFTGKWHLAGRFVPARQATSSGSSTVAGAPVAPGQPSVVSRNRTYAPTAAAPALGRKAEAASVVPAAVLPEAAPATTRTVVTQKWHVSAPVIGLAVGIALIGIGNLVLLSVLDRRRAAR